MTFNLTSILQTLIWACMVFVIFLFLRKPTCNLINRIKSAKWGSRELTLEVLKTEETKKIGTLSKELATFDLGGSLAGLIAFIGLGAEKNELDKQVPPFLDRSIRYAKEAGFIQQVEILKQMKNDFLAKQKNITWEDRKAFIDRFRKIGTSIEKKLDTKMEENDSTKI